VHRIPRQSVLMKAKAFDSVISPREGANLSESGFVGLVGPLALRVREIKQLFKDISDGRYRRNSGSTITFSDKINPCIASTFANTKRVSTGTRLFMFLRSILYVNNFHTHVTLMMRGVRPIAMAAMALQTWSEMAESGFRVKRGQVSMAGFFEATIRSVWALCGRPPHKPHNMLKLSLTCAEEPNYNGLRFRKILMPTYLRRRK